MIWVFKNFEIHLSWNSEQYLILIIWIIYQVTIVIPFIGS